MLLSGGGLEIAACTGSSLESCWQRLQGSENSLCSESGNRTICSAFTTTCVLSRD